MSKRKTQKILVPKGTINPNEDVVIEIPVELKDQPMVVAKRPDKNRSYRRLPMPDYEDNVGGRKSKKKLNRSITGSNDDIDLYNKLSNTSALNRTGVDNLDETEKLEKDLIQAKLEDFQQARRMFILETTSVATNASAMPLEDFDTDFKNKKLLSSSLIKADRGKQFNQSTAVCGGSKPLKQFDDSQDSDSSDDAGTKNCGKPTEKIKSGSDQGIKKSKQELPDGGCGNKKSSSFCDKPLDKSKASASSINSKNSKEKQIGGCEQKRESSKQRLTAKALTFDDISPCTTPIKSKRSKEKEVDSCGQTTERPKRKKSKDRDANDNSPCNSPVKTKRSKEKEVGGCVQRIKSPDDDSRTSKKRKEKGKDDEQSEKGRRKKIDRKLDSYEMLAYGPRRRTKALQWPDDDDNTGNTRKSSERKAGGCRPYASGSVLTNRIREWSCNDDNMSSSFYACPKRNWSVGRQTSPLHTYSKTDSRFQPNKCVTPPNPTKCIDKPLQGRESTILNKAPIFPEKDSTTICIYSKPREPREASDYGLLNKAIILPSQSDASISNYPRKYERPSKEANDPGLNDPEKEDYSKKSRTPKEANDRSLLNKALTYSGDDDYSKKKRRAKEANDYGLLNQVLRFPEDDAYIGGSFRPCPSNSTRPVKICESFVNQHFLGPDDDEEEDVFHVEELMTSFQHARTKLNDAIKLANSTLEQFKAIKNYSRQSLDESGSKERVRCPNKQCVQKIPEQQSRTKSPLKSSKHSRSDVAAVSKHIVDKESIEVQTTITNTLYRSLDSLAAQEDQKSREDKTNSFRKVKSSRSLNLPRD